MRARPRARERERHVCACVCMLCCWVGRTARMRSLARRRIRLLSPAPGTIVRARRRGAPPGQRAAKRPRAFVCAMCCAWRTRRRWWWCHAVTHSLSGVRHWVSRPVCVSSAAASDSRSIVVDVVVRGTLHGPRWRAAAASFGRRFNYCYEQHATRERRAGGRAASNIPSITIAMAPASLPLPACVHDAGISRRSADGRVAIC